MLSHFWPGYIPGHLQPLTVMTIFGGQKSSFPFLFGVSSPSVLIQGTRGQAQSPLSSGGSPEFPLGLTVLKWSVAHPPQTRCLPPALADIHVAISNLQFNSCWDCVSFFPQLSHTSVLLRSTTTTHSHHPFSPLPLLFPTDANSCL